MTHKEYQEATNQWSRLEGLIQSYTAGADFYYVLRHPSYDAKRDKHNFLMFNSVLAPRANEENLEELMNNEIKKMLHM